MHRGGDCQVIFINDLKSQYTNIQFYSVQTFLETTILSKLKFTVPVGGNVSENVWTEQNYNKYCLIDF